MIVLSIIEIEIEFGCIVVEYDENIVISTPCMSLPYKRISPHSIRIDEMSELLNFLYIVMLCE